MINDAGTRLKVAVALALLIPRKATRRGNRLEKSLSSQCDQI